MITNYIKTAFRSLAQSKGFAFINIAGLSVALAVFLIIILFVRHETNYDNFYTDSDQLYRLMLTSDSTTFSQVLPEPVGSDLLRIYPEVSAMVRITGPSTNQLISGNGTSLRGNSYSAGEDFFNLFDFRFLKGNPERALEGPDSIVLTESMARRLFGRIDVVGEPIVLSNQMNVTVTGVIVGPPSNTHLQFDYIWYRVSPDNQNWMMRGAITYIKLPTKEMARVFEEKLPAYVEEYKSDNASDVGLMLQPVTDIHLYPSGPGTHSSRVFYIRVLFVVAFLILFVACINYINLSSARMVDRLREVGVRKAAGASRSQIFFQITMESLFVVLIAFFLSLFLVELILPKVGQYFDVSLSSLLSLPWFWVLMLTGLLLFIGVSGGFFVSVILSSLKPAQILKGNTFASGRFSGGFRKSLVVFQFVISISIVLSTLLIMQQMSFVRTERMDGLDKQIVTISNVNRMVEGHFDLFKQELLQHPDILFVSGGRIPTQIGSTFVYDDTTTVYGIFTEVDYLKTLGLQLLSGRDFRNEDYPHDGITRIIINKSAADVINVDEATGQLIDVSKIGVYGDELVGIVEDFYPRTLFDPIQPVVIRPRTPDYSENFLIRFREGQTASALDHVQEVWADLNPDWPLSYSFLDDILDQDYQAEIRAAKIFRVFSGFSIFIACLGLFGLAAYMARKRIKEIGIRKVLGASITNILTLLNKDFVQLVLIGFLISIPITWYAMNRWLQDFAYKIEIGPGVFLIAGASVLAIALITVSWQSVRAAAANPAKSLRTE